MKFRAGLAIVALAACGSTPGAKPGGGTGGEEEPTGGAGGRPGTGGTTTTSVGGMTGTGGMLAPDAAVAIDADMPAGTGGSPGSDAAVTPDSAPAAGGFTCSQLVGPSPMFQWFNGGFLKYPGIDPAKWQLIWMAHHYTDAWAKPGDAAWNLALDGGHACANGSKSPDRVIFQATQWSHTTAAEWITDLTGIVNNIKTKWPGVKRIELMVSTSAPGNMACPGASKNNETIIPTIGYEAIEAMPAKFPGLVFALPHFEVPCKDFIGNGTSPQYKPNAMATNSPEVMDVAGIFGAYWAMHP
jgi:hypothetical protein